MESAVGVWLTPVLLLRYRDNVDRIMTKQYGFELMLETHHGLGLFFLRGSYHGEVCEFQNNLRTVRLPQDDFSSNRAELTGR